MQAPGTRATKGKKGQSVISLGMPDQNTTARAPDTLGMYVLAVPDLEVRGRPVSARPAASCSLSPGFADGRLLVASSRGPPSAWVCVSVSSAPLLIRKTVLFDEGPSHDSFFLSRLFPGPISKCIHMLRVRRLGRSNTIQPIMAYKKGTWLGGHRKSGPWVRRQSWVGGAAGGRRTSSGPPR